MKIRGLLIAVVALAALGGGVWWSEKNKKDQENKPSKDAPPKILSIPEDQIQEIRLERLAGEATSVKRGAGGKWDIIEPRPLKGDQDSINSLVTTLASLSSDRLVEEKVDDLSPYGLKTPTITVSIKKKDGKTETLLLGDDTPTSGGTFAKLASDPRLFTVASYIKSSVDKYAKDLRDRRLLTFDSEKLTRVELQAKGGPIEFGKNNQNEWQILKPKPYRADGSQVEELVRKLKDAKMDTTISDEEAAKAPAKFAAAAKVAVATVSDAAGNQTIEIRKDKDNNYYAKSTAVEGVYRVPADTGTGLDKGLDDYRNKKLFDFGFSDPSKVDYNKAVYQKSGEKWMSGAKQMDSSSVQTLIDKLRDLQASKFLDASAGTPVMEATVTSNDGKRVEKVIVFKQGEKYSARRENEQGAYELDSKAVEELQKAAAEVKEYQPPKDEKKKK